MLLNDQSEVQRGFSMNKNIFVSNMKKNNHYIQRKDRRLNVLVDNDDKLVEGNKAFQTTERKITKSNLAYLLKKK